MTNLSTMTREQLEAMVLKFQSQPQRKLTMKVSEKGALSIYGMGRFPVTLYKQQWLRLLDAGQEIKDYIELNDSLLSVNA
jgi:hypothetical protein